MAAKKDDVTTYTKAELIKALRASVAREAKLQKRIAALEQAAPLPKPDRYTEARRRARVLVSDYAEASGEDQAPPAFPWDVK